MIDGLLESINLALLQHPHLLHVMHGLMWARCWLLLGIFGVFVYLVWAEEQRMKPASPRESANSTPNDTFIA